VPDETYEPETQRTYSSYDFVDRITYDFELLNWWERNKHWHASKPSDWEAFDWEAFRKLRAQGEKGLY
jgi:hypothetical protein